MRVEDQSEFVLTAIDPNVEGHPDKARVTMENAAGVRLSALIPHEQAAHMEVGVTRARFALNGQRGN